jgi:hypothetical protein
MSTAKVWRVTGTASYTLHFDETVMGEDSTNAATAFSQRVTRQDRLRLPAGFNRTLIVYTRIEPEPET